MMRAQNEAWGLGYIDLFLIHFPVALEYVEPEKRRYPGWWMDDGSVRPAKVPMRETWEAMEQMVDEGIAKSIGVSNFQAQLLLDVMSYAKHPISNLQIEHHPYLVQQDLIDLAHEHKIIPTAYSSFGPQSFLELPPKFRKRTEGLTPLFEQGPVVEAAKAHNVTPAQVLLRWASQRGIAVIPKSNSKDRLKQNLDIIQFDLSKEELEKISNLDIGLKFNDPGFYLDEHPLRIFA